MNILLITICTISIIVNVTLIILDIKEFYVFKKRLKDYIKEKSEE